jgi:hypothetical protein
MGGALSIFYEYSLVSKYGNEAKVFHQKLIPIRPEQFEGEFQDQVNYRDPPTLGFEAFPADSGLLYFACGQAMALSKTVEIGVTLEWVFMAERLLMSSINPASN